MYVRAGPSSKIIFPPVGDPSTGRPVKAVVDITGPLTEDPILLFPFKLIIPVKEELYPCMPVV